MLPITDPSSDPSSGPSSGASSAPSSDPTQMPKEAVGCTVMDECINPQMGPWAEPKAEGSVRLGLRGDHEGGRRAYA